MKLIAMILVGVLLISGCGGNARERCRTKLARLYTTHKSSLSRLQEVNGFSMQMSFVPSALLPQAGNNKQGGEEKEPQFYYFRLSVDCPPDNLTTGGNKTALHYHLDSLFSTSPEGPPSWPAIVEPITTGSQQRYEYLIAFQKQDLDKHQKTRITFFDRLFTNTRMVFDFDKTKIEELETYHCYAKKG